MTEQMQMFGAVRVPHGSLSVARRQQIVDQVMPDLLGDGRKYVLVNDSPRLERECERLEIWVMEWK